MEDYITSLFEAFGNYINVVAESSQWWLILATLAAIWLLIIVSTKFIQDSEVLTREFKILTRIILISICVEFILLSWFLYNWMQTEFYQSDTEKLVHTLCIISCIIIEVIVYKLLANGFEREKIKQNINCPITNGDLVHKNKIAMQQFKKAKLWSIIPTLSFLVLLLPLKKDKNLVSFILDTSSSMDTHIEDGKEILTKSFQNINNDTDIILSWFSENNLKKDFTSLINTKDRSELDGVHQYFTNKESAIESLNTIEFTTLTPLFETIWSNYLYTTEITQNKKYDNTIFVLVTDGEDTYFSENTHNFLCDVSQFNDFYQDNINIINLEGLNNSFFEKAIDCNYTIYEGMDTYSYSQAIQDILKDVKKDYYFPAWLFICCFSGIIILLLIKPKKY